ncbi:unnamed protein product [Callosobruchus maculatus]|uniref:Uncharacterized protein n=1 Tax=Callosobruchus maculatus TaxID=64391 RepID=A0A653C3D9_CALMS|nr:unnamed protein product [Callosobruchus maculatus]
MKVCSLHFNKGLTTQRGRILNLHKSFQAAANFVQLLRSTPDIFTKQKSARFRSAILIELIH